MSPPPPATTTCAGRPQRPASAMRNVPEGADPSTRRGMCPRDRPVAASRSSDQSRAPVSNQLVPEASDISATWSPVNQSRRKSFGSSTFATRSHSAGSWRWTHMSFGAVKPGKTMLPVTRRNIGSASSSAASSKLRVSFHRMQGRSTSSAASSRVAPCIWPDRPMPRTPRRPCAASCSITCSVAAIQSAGDCSLHPAKGRLTVSGALASASTR